LHYIYYDFWFVSFVKHGTNNMVSRVVQLFYIQKYH